MQMKHKAAAALFFASPFMGTFVLAQATGVSHPEQIPITTSSEGTTQPVVYQPTPKSTVLRTRDESRRETQATDASGPLHADTPAPDRSEPKASAALEVTSNTDSDTKVVTRVGDGPNRLPVGTLVKVMMNVALTTKDTKAGSNFAADLTEAVVRDGRVLLPVGSVLAGRVTDVHGGRRISGSASIHLQPTSITLPDGTKYNFRGQVIDTGLFRSTRVDGEGTIVRRDYALRTLSAMTLGTGSGAAAGAMLGGWPGALLGAGVGAGVSTVVWLKQDRQTELPAHTQITFALTSPMQIGAE